MPNGKPGDDWFTDIVAHDLPTFSPTADQEVKDVAASSSTPRPQALIGFVDGFLAAIGYDELHARHAPTVGMEYRQLRSDELLRLEEGLRRLRDTLNLGDGI